MGGGRTKAVRKEDEKMESSKGGSLEDSREE